MKTFPIHLLNQSPFIKDYRENKPELMHFFDYHPLNDYKERLKDLKKRTYKREQLAGILHKANEKWDAPEATFQNIERLKQDDSVVVVGGQQAGLLTGPLYTIHKMVSILVHAKQQERSLGVPVIPVFWIAGEDHDFDEINHVYMPNDLKMKKEKLSTYVTEKKSVSHMEMVKDDIDKWIDGLCMQLEETTNSKELYRAIREIARKSVSYTDFFAMLTFHLFSEEGLVLVDAASDDLRALESDYFTEIIHGQQQITEGVHKQLQTLKGIGYDVSLDASSTDAHLFYHLDGERILLTKQSETEWAGKQGEVVFTTEELLEIAAKTPALLSNNVVTRPLMQEKVFPTLAFIGGPGEIGYWAGLKPAFHSLNMNMPPVVPRLSLTLIEPAVQKDLEVLDINVETAINKGVKQIQDAWLQAKTDPEIEETFAKVKEQISEAHQPLQQIARAMSADIGALSKKNLMYLHQDLDYLKKRMEKAIEQEYEHELERFKTIEYSLHPYGGLQERVWNILPFLNIYGKRIVTQLNQQNLSFTNNHYAVYL